MVVVPRMASHKKGDKMNEFNVKRATLFIPAGRIDSTLPILSASDIHQPWRSVFGFPMAAAQLAAHQDMLFHCRTDEVFNYLARLNKHLDSPESLNRAFELLGKLERETQKKLVRLFEQKKQPIQEEEIQALLDQVEQLLAGSSGPVAADRLDVILSPGRPFDEVVGSGRMLARLRVLVKALAQVKDTGLHVVVTEGYRQPARPALTARHADPILWDGQPSGLTAGFLQPLKLHLTLWAYRLTHSSNGQSAVWN